MSQTSKSQSEKGTILLTTLLIMTVMAAMTVALMDDIRLAVRRTINVQAYAQVDWQARGAEDFITAYLETDFLEMEPAAKSALLQANAPLVLPTPGGAITLTLKDASHCFNLNSVLFETGEQNGQAMLEFTELAKLLGVPQNQAVALSSALVDWQDPDQQLTPGGAEDGNYLRRKPPYRTADTALRSPDEMRALNGMDEDLWELFQPFVCTGPPSTQDENGDTTAMSVNVNSLQPERLAVLAVAISGSSSGEDAVPAAEMLIRDRPPLTGYSASGLETKKTEITVEDLNLDRVSIEVSAIFVEVTTQVGLAERARTYRYDGVDTGALRLTYRGWGQESFRPEIKTKTETKSETEVDAR